MSYCMMQIALGHLCSLSRAGVRCIRSSDPRMAVDRDERRLASKGKQLGTEPNLRHETRVTATPDPAAP